MKLPVLKSWQTLSYPIKSIERNLKKRCGSKELYAKKRVLIPRRDRNFGGRSTLQDPSKPGRKLPGRTSRWENTRFKIIHGQKRIKLEDGGNSVGKKGPSRDNGSSPYRAQGGEEPSLQEQKETRGH